MWGNLNIRKIEAQFQNKNHSANLSLSTIATPQLSNYTRLLTSTFEFYHKLKPMNFRFLLNTFLGFQTYPNHTSK